MICDYLSDMDNVRGRMRFIPGMRWEYCDDIAGVKDRADRRRAPWCLGMRYE